MDYSYSKIGLKDNYVIYLERDYNPEMNAYIREHIDLLRSGFARQGRTFVFIPDLLRRLTPTLLSYNFPTLDGHEYILDDSLRHLYFNLEKSLGLGIMFSCPALIYYDAATARVEIRSLNSVDDLEAVVSSLHGQALEKKSGRSPRRERHFDKGVMLENIFSSDTEADCSVPDYQPTILPAPPFVNPDDDNIEAIAEIIRLNLARLRQAGVGEDFIRALYRVEEKLSRLVITQDGEIQLPDFRKTIYMPALSKALYILYLKHPEGIRFVDLQDHRDELLDIYRSISLREDYETMVRSVDTLVDPFNNSINEKISRIKRSFVSVMADDVARNYYISGPAGGIKTIPLDRQLVQIDSLR